MLLSRSGQLAAQELVEPSTLQSPALDRVVLPTPSPVLEPRPAVLVPLYVSFGAMQALDMLSTRHALAQGGREGNPVLGAASGSPVATAALKAGATATIIVLTEKLAKRNRFAAIAVMVGLNSAYAIVVSHNYAIGR
jgi:hypothetical protein